MATSYHYPYDDVDRTAPTVLTGEFLARDLGGGHFAPAIGLIVVQNAMALLFTAIVCLALMSKPLWRNILLGVFWSADLPVTVLCIRLCRKDSPTEKALRAGEYRIATLRLERLTQEAVHRFGRGYGGPHVYRDVYHFEGIEKPYTKIAKPGRVQLRAAEGDKFYVVFLDSRPGVPILIYPADGYRLP